MEANIFVDNFSIIGKHQHFNVCSSIYSNVADDVKQEILEFHNQYADLL
jgi:hypothetical protein